MAPGGRRAGAGAKKLPKVTPPILCCKECKELLPAAAFNVDRETRTGRSTMCGRCKALNLRLGRRFRQLRGDQCEACGSRESLHADHDHETLEFRGTLCVTCNALLGFVERQPERLEQIERYLESRPPTERTG